MSAHMRHKLKSNIEVKYWNIVKVTHTLPAQAVSQRISNQIENQSSETPPTLASGKASAPTNNGINNITTNGTI